VRRKPATYDRILKNIRGCTVNIHWVITRPMLERSGYLEEYISFWSGRPEVNCIWASTYSPQVGERTPEMLRDEDREELMRQLSGLARRYPKFLLNRRISQAVVAPPKNPQECLFSRMSTTYSADLKTHVEPCVLGGTPDCSQCGCIASVGLHSVNSAKLFGSVKVNHLVQVSMAVGKWVAGFRDGSNSPIRWQAPPTQRKTEECLVQMAGSSLEQVSFELHPEGVRKEP